MSTQRYHHTDSVIGEFLNPTDPVIEDMKARGQPPKNYYAEERKRVRQIEAQKRAEREEEERKAAAGLWKDPQFRNGQSRVMEAVEASIAEASAKAAASNGGRAPLPASARPGGSGPHYTQQEIERARARGQEIREEARRVEAQRAARENGPGSAGSRGSQGSRGSSGSREVRASDQPRAPRDFSYAGYREELRQQEQAAKARQERKLQEERQREIKVGQKPAYIEERKRQWAQEEAARREEEERRREEARVPPGTRKLGDEERKALLAELRTSLQAEIKRLNSFSVTSNVASTLRAREDCERKIDQIEATIRQFERPGDVFIALD